MDDEDRHWFAGIYFNRDDRRVFVPKRFGLGLGRTLNLARPVAWLVLAAPIALALIIGLSRRL